MNFVIQSGFQQTNKQTNLTKPTYYIFSFGLFF
jgi:hypothetical protein